MRAGADRSYRRMSEPAVPEEPAGDAIAAAAPDLLAAKAHQPSTRMAMLAVLAGVFIAFGSVASLVAQAGMGGGGAVSLLSGLAFSVGLVSVMIVGAELFTGNTMMLLARVTGRLGLGRMLGAWGVVWLGNLAGSLAIAGLFAASGGLGDGVDDAARALVAGKLAKTPLELVASAVLANMLVCLAVWMAITAPTIPGKILAVVGPVTVFVAAGLEHSIANMSLIPLGWFAAPLDRPDLAAGALNLVLTTLGNIAGGGLLAIGIAYGHDKLGSAPD
jgi:formate/nitrite transporter